RAERVSAVGRLPGDDAGRVDDIRILRIDFHLGEVRLPGRDAVVGGDLVPVRTRVVRAVQSIAARRVDGGEHPARHAGRDGEADAAEPVLLEGRQAGAEFLPRRAAVGRAVQPAPRAGELSVLPRSLARLPQRTEERVRVGRVHHDVDGTGILVLI